MGVPKFFRYMSERYPCLSEVIKEYQIPEFDNLYLDMNGIIHNCSHPNDNDPHFRITEKQIFQDIFHYIEILFRMIQPKQLFFMAIDGVAPRAKMNQQRGRRFRSAKEAEVLEQKAREKGDVLPTEKRFDSNCITPGTPFMYRLHQQLRYFVKLKMTTDKLWKNVRVILSGHETPGEGEHKIMDYIRYMKAQPNYNPNLRHCLYGLDADLIMLGLCTHEPYFSLLREEVKFNTKSNKGGSQILTPEETKFFLLHLSLMRDYLELEFSKLKEPGVLPFPFDIEKVIDDWVLLGFLVGNDFIPNLPDLHIINGALPLMYKVYMEALPTLGGHINEAGSLNLSRFETFMRKLASFDFEQFREKYADIQYLEGKTGKKHTDIFRKEQSKKNMDPDLAALIKATDDDFDFDDGTAEVLNYADYEEYYYSDEDRDWRKNFFTEFGQHKTDYYRYKLDYQKVTNEVLRDQAECYVRAIQWNLHYYYNGCVSWSWYYPHHYAPYISDIKDFSHLNLKYEMGEPFLPFQQLLAVLPAASKELLPKPYQDLMTLENSPILEYYPEEFQSDLNGKKQEWEAVVLIPFIDEKKLIDAMDAVEHLLTDEERSRNRHGPMLVYTFTHENLGVAQAPEHFPPIQENHALEKHMYRTDIYVHPSKLNKGLCPNVNMALYRTHFPTLKHLKFTHKIEMAKVKVFQQPSRGESVVLTLDRIYYPGLKQMADQILGKTILIKYPHLVEIKVQALASKDSRIFFDKNIGQVCERTAKDVSDEFQLSKKSISDDYYSKQGIVIGNTDILVYGQPVESRKYFFGARGKVTQHNSYIRTTVTYALQTSVLNVKHATEYLENKTIDDIFYVGCQCFTLSNPHYGSEGCVIGTVKDENSYIKFSLKVQQEPDLSNLVNMKYTSEYNYLPTSTVASKLSITPLLLSRFTGSIFIVNSEEDDRRSNIGLNIKFSRKNEEVVGFTRRDDTTKKWYYTEKVVTLIKDYMQAFPEVFFFLRAHSSDDIYLRDEVFPTNGAERVAEIMKWLKEQPHSKAEVRPCGAAVVDENIVAMIEKTVDACDKVEKKITLLVRPNKLYLPKPTLDKICPDPDTRFELFDRVVNIRDCYTVPLGYRGTIIGVIKGDTQYDTMYDVVLDKPFPHGVKIRCSESRGYRLPAQALINISHGERLHRSNNPCPYPKNINMMRTRVDNRENNRGMRQPNYQDKPVGSFFKDNSPSMVYQPAKSQVPSPYHTQVSRPNSQLSSPNVSRSSESPKSVVLSQQSSPFLTNKDTPLSGDARNINKSPLQTIVSNKHFDAPEINGNEKKVIINKEERCIFSNPAFPTSMTQNPEIPSGGLSFFGYPNILDIPENKTKLFRGDLVASKPEVPADKESSSEKETNVTQDQSINTNVCQQEPKPTTTKSRENSFTIPSISDLVKQNNITAKADYQTTNALQDFIYSPSSSFTVKEDTKIPSGPEAGKSFTTTLTNLFNRRSTSRESSESNSIPEVPLPTHGNAFEQAISAMVKQSPLLLSKEETVTEPTKKDIELSFEEKYGMNEAPTIKTEMRKITKSNSQDLEEEEEVMIIELKENENKEVEKHAINPLTEFLSKLNVSNTQESRNKQFPGLKNIENIESNLTTVTADTVNEFFMNEAQRKQVTSDTKETNTEFHQMNKPAEQQLVGQSSKESNVNPSDMLKKMLNIESTSSKHDVIQPQERQKPTSAFKAVVPNSAVPEKEKLAPKNVMLSSLQKKSVPLNPNVASFIPPQVQKQHYEKIKYSTNIEQGRVAPPEASGVLAAFIHPQQNVVRPQDNLPRAAHVPHRGVPILGSQSNTYTQPNPYQYYYPNQQSSFQQGYYPPQSHQVQYPHAIQKPLPQPYANMPNRTHQPLVQNNPQAIQPNQQIFTPPAQGQHVDSAAKTSWPAHPFAQNRVYRGTNPQQPQVPSQLRSHPVQSRAHFTGPQTAFTQQNLPHPITAMPSQHHQQSAGTEVPRVDTFLLKLLTLTKVNKLGQPDYSFEMDANKLYIASVRITHPVSDYVFKSKPCTRKSDAVEICARRAYKELSQVYPTGKPKLHSSKSEQNKPDLPETQSTEPQQPSSSNEEKKEKRPKMAAKFTMPLKPNI